MEFISPTADLRVLCFALGTRKVLITHWYFVLLRGAGTASRLSQHFPLTSWLRMSEILEGDTARTSDPNWPKEQFIPLGIFPAIKAKRKGWGHSLLWCLSFEETTTCTKAQLPEKGLKIACWWQLEGKNKYFVFLCFCKWPLLFLSQTAFILTHKFFPSYFFPVHHPAEEVEQ